MSKNEFDLAVHNILSLAKAFSRAGGEPVFLVDKYKEFLYTITTNNIKLEMTYLEKIQYDKNL